ncbi:Transposase, Mutator family [Eubacterium oxidoreducens]|uniref:Transposase, Mutator family n=1 Tax=Eubacterium oxidoreducens TaxID=1732 RepID=A0A1G6BM05_EUBOX|nr:Transposase, Mutator family [Eubacterium oxidoreducens]
MTDGKRQIIQQLLQEYDIESAQDIQDALKDLLGETIKEMMESEMDNHLGYERSERVERTDSDRNLSAEADPNPACKTRSRVLTLIMRSLEFFLAIFASV